MKIHTQDFVKFYHYYNNDKFCPFEELGCKFLHKVAQNCGLGKTCKIWLCPRRHLDKEMDNVIDRDDKQCNDDEEQFSNDEEISARADGGPRPRVCARETLRNRNFLAKSENSKHLSFFQQKSPKNLVILIKI